MRVRLMVILVLIGSFISCQKEVEIKDGRFRTWLNPDFKLEKGFLIKINMTVIYDDVFKVYYTENITEQFNENKTLQSKISGNKAEQIITFNFPKGIKPHKLRIDFGINKKQNYFDIKSIEINNYDDYLKIQQDSILTYFEIFNNNLFYDSISKHYKVVKGPNKKYLPSIFSTERLSNHIIEWYKD